MTTDVQNEDAQTLPETFVKQVRDALKHIYDLRYLQSHPLAQELGTGVSTEIAGQRLRRELVAAIEALNPGPDVPFRAPEARLYRVLALHYMERMTVQETAHQLAVSQRQAMRNLRQAEESLAVVLWGRRATLPPEQSSAVRASSFQTEMAQLEAPPQPIDVRSLVNRAQESTEPRARQRSVALQAQVPGAPMILSTNPVVAQQVMTSTLSHAVGQARQGTLLIALSADQAEQRFTLALRYAPEPEAVDIPGVNPTAAQLSAWLGWTMEQVDEAGDLRTISIHMTSRNPIVLIVDDNQGLVSLLERYLTDHACRVVAAADGQEGLRLAQETLPDAILLDVMMPQMDGWAVLQRLRNDPRTADIPVIICSVVNDPDLAQALKAALFLPKPVRQVDVLAALRELDII